MLLTLALGVVKTTVPAWLRTGVLGLAVGGLLIGLTWPYAIGPLGADIGAMLATSADWRWSSVAVSRCGPTVTPAPDDPSDRDLGRRPAVALLHFAERLAPSPSR